MRCLLADKDRIRFEMRARWSLVSEDIRDGWFRLYNKNAMTTTHVKPVDQVPNAAVWIVEADEPIDQYFQHVLTPA